jgi:hypothetical protein
MSYGITLSGHLACFISRVIHFAIHITVSGYSSMRQIINDPMMKRRNRSQPFGLSGSSTSRLFRGDVQSGTHGMLPSLTEE